MENEKRKIKNEIRKPEGEELSAVRYRFSVKRVCAACGAVGRRDNAKFCLTCGKLLAEDYQPLDNLRSSYRSQGKFLSAENERGKDISNLFEQNKNSIAQTAWACLVYSFVPYLGILFVPLAFFVGSLGVVVSYNQPNLGGRKLALSSVFLSLVILVVQIFLWWLLYVIPELGER